MIFLLQRAHLHWGLQMLACKIWRRSASHNMQLPSTDADTITFMPSKNVMPVTWPLCPFSVDLFPSDKGSTRMSPCSAATQIRLRG